MTDIYRIGDKVRIYGTLLVNGVATDPNTLTITITDPTLAQTVYEWNVDPEVVRTGVGEFYFDLTITQQGTWSYEWNSNGSLTSFSAGEIEVADPVTVQTVDDSATPVVVPFVRFKIYDADLIRVAEGETDGTGEASVYLPDGTYRLNAYKLEWKFPTVVQDLIGTGPFTLTAVGTALTQGWLKIPDLERAINVETVDRLFHDDNTGFRNPDLLQAVIQEAESIAESKMLRSWSRENISLLAAEDDGFRVQAAWIALELASERRSEFIAADGKGRFWAQLERSMKYFDDLSKSKLHSRGEVAAGQSANTGAGRRPTRTDPNQSSWVFADEGDGSKHGGF